jgi:hypothetical protein
LAGDADRANCARQHLGIRPTATERALEDPDDPHLPPVDFTFAEVLSQDEREAWGQIDPMFMGGEYLPELEPGEVEIARIELESVTGDVLQVRARQAEDGLRYRVVDEYGTRYHLTPSASASPLSFGDLIDLIDTARVTADSENRFDDDRYDIGLFDGILNATYDHGGDLEETRHFVSVSSAFYPTLTEYYERRAEAWCQRAPTDAVAQARRSENGVNVLVAPTREGLAAILDSPAVLNSRIRRIVFRPLIRLAYGVGLIEGAAQALLRRTRGRA